MAAFVYLLAAVAILLTYWMWSRQRKFQLFSKTGIPGPPPHWLYGHLLDIRPNYQKGSEDPVQMKHQWLKKYGKVVGYYNGIIPNIIITDLELLRQVLIKDFNSFTNRSAQFSSPKSKTLISMQDKKWKDTRRIMTPIFSSAKMKMMMPLMQECVEMFLERCDSLAETKEEFNAHYELQCLTLDVIDRCAMALDLHCIKNPTGQIIERVRKIFTTNQSKFLDLANVFPEFAILLRPLRVFSYIAKTKEFFVSHIHDVISKRKSDPKMLLRQDALQMMLDATDPMSAAKTKLTEREVGENAFLFLLAGYDTTSNALSYTIHLLSVHPEVQDAILKEVREVCGENMPTYDDLSKLPYTEAVMNESLRMYPPVPTFNRKASSDIVYGDIKILKGMTIEAAVWSIHHDEDIYPQPHVFRPERFLPENKNYHPMAFVPFGAGPRNCIGSRFAMMESKLALATLVSKYFINPTPRTKDPLPTITRTIITNPRDGVWITLARRC